MSWKDQVKHLGVPFEPGMLEYGEQDHGRLKSGLGDWNEKIKSGRIQAPAPPPGEIPEPLRPIAATWGYLPQTVAAETS